MILLARFGPTLAKYQQNLFAISSESVIVTPCSCINEILRGLHFLRFIAKFRIFHVALIALLFLTSRASQCFFFWQFLIIASAYFCMFCMYSVYHLSEISGVFCTACSFGLMISIIPRDPRLCNVLFNSLPFTLLKGKQVSKIPIFFPINES